MLPSTDYRSDDPWPEDAPFDPFDDAASFGSRDGDLAIAPGADPNAVAEEVRRIRNREAAQAFVAAEKRACEPLPPFDAGTLADILARPPQPAHRVRDMCAWGGSTLVVASRKVGKTTLDLNLARSLLTGQDFLGRFKVRPVTGRIAILNYEVSGEMLASWAEDHGIDRDRLFLVNLRGKRNPLSHPTDRERLTDLLRSQNVETLIVDPFGRAYTGASQNDAGEVQAFLADLDMFARSEVGATDLVLSAHAGWNGERTRGSSALEDWADTIIQLTFGRDGDEQDSKDRYFRAFGRLGDVDEDRLDFDPSTRRLNLAGVGSRRTVAKTQHIDALVEPVVSAVKANPGAGVAEIIAELRKAGVCFQDRDVSKAGKLAAERGLIELRPLGKGKRTEHYPTPSNPVQWTHRTYYP